MDAAGAGRGARSPRSSRIGALSTALAYVVYFRILAGAGATNVVLVTLLAPATSILLGAVVLGERLAARDFVGLAPDRGRPRLHRRPPAARGAGAAGGGRTPLTAPVSARLPNCPGAR